MSSGLTSQPRSNLLVLGVPIELAFYDRFRLLLREEPLHAALHPHHGLLQFIKLRQTPVQFFLEISVNILPPIRDVSGAPQHLR